MKPHRAVPIASGCAVALLLAACGGSTSSAPPQAASQVFTYDTTATVMDDGWDPATEYSDGILAMSQMYETLTRYDAATHTVEPLLATSWSSSDNGKTWTFHLRHGVHFHTGRLMTAQAAKAAILRTHQAGRRRRLRLGRGEQHRHPRPVHARVPPEVPRAARPGGLGLLLGLHLRHPGGRPRREPDQVAEHPARRGHRALRGADLEQGPGARGHSQGLPRLLGRLERPALQEGRVPGGDRGHHRRPAAALGRRRLRGADRPQHSGSRSRATRASGRWPRRPGRTCWPSSTRSR